MERTEVYRGFAISWQEPPQTGAGWVANVGSENRQLHYLMGIPGVKIIEGRSRDEMLAKARDYIDNLLNQRGRSG